MSKYYYFSASLPTLMFDQASPCSVEDFLAQTERHVSADDHKVLAAVAMDGELPSRGVAGKWAYLRHQIRNMLASMRAVHAGKEGSKYIRGDKPFEPIAAEVAQEALKHKDPLSAEKAFDRRLWHVLDNLQSGHMFDMGFLIVYVLKLRILEKYKKAASDQGRQAFEAILKNERLAEVLATVSS